MPRTMYAVSLFVLLMAAPFVLAGPPEGASGKMVLDEVADGLRHYQKATSAERRAEWLWKLGNSRDPSRDYSDVLNLDPRVLVALGEALYGEKTFEQFAAVMLLHCYLPLHPERACSLPNVKETKEWWTKNEAEVRRRAKQLP